MLSRRNFSTQLSACAVASAAPGLALAQGAGNARLLIGFPPGASFDAFARRIAEKLRGTLAPNVIVENKTGAGGQIAISTLKDSPGDGSSLLVSPSGLFSIFQHTYAKLPYKISDVKPVALGVFIEPCIAVGPAVPATVKTLKDLIAWMKADPARASYGSPGAGSMLHLIGAYISKVTNLNWRHVAYRGGAPAIQDLIGGQISAVILPIGDFLTHVKAGTVRILAVSSKQRSRFMPDVPTLRENGIVLSAREWYGFYLPASASPELVRRTAAYLQVALTHPDTVAWTTSMAMDMQFKGPDETAAQLKSDGDEWRQLIKLIGLTSET